MYVHCTKLWSFCLQRSEGKTCGLWGKFLFHNYIMHWTDIMNDDVCKGSTSLKNSFNCYADKKGVHRITIWSVIDLQCPFPVLIVIAEVSLNGHFTCEIELTLIYKQCLAMTNIIKAICIPGWTHLYLYRTHTSIVASFLFISCYALIRLTRMIAQLLPLDAYASVSPLYKLLFSFSHPSLPPFFNKAGLQVWVHPGHFAMGAHLLLCIARSRLGGPLTHHQHLSCGLLLTLQTQVSICHFQPHVTGCVAATLLQCPFMLRVGCCHPQLLH